jgi:hypothetical protein
MRRSIPLQWIEESEATHVLESAIFERPAGVSRQKPAGAMLADWLERVHSWVAPQLPVGWPQLQMQPVLVRRTEGLRVRRNSEGDDYRCSW